MTTAPKRNLKDALELINAQRKDISLKIRDYRDVREYMYSKIDTMWEKFNAIHEVEEYDPSTDDEASNLMTTIRRYTELREFVGNGTHDMQKEIEVLFVLTESLVERTDCVNNKDLIGKIEVEINLMSKRLKYLENVFVQIKEDLFKEIK